MITGYSGGGGFGNSASGRGGSDGSDGYDGTGDVTSAPGGGSGVQISEIPLTNFALRYVKYASVMNSLGSIIGRPVIGHA